MILPCLAFLEQGESWLLRMLNASTRQNAHTRDAHEASILSGCLRHTLDFSKIFYFLCVLREELSTRGMWR
jgi:hypothetical protein